LRAMPDALHCKSGAIADRRLVPQEIKRAMQS